MGKPITIADICKHYPNSKGKVFYIEGHEYRMYWLNSNMEYVRNDKVHARCDVITVDTILDKIFVERLTIKAGQIWVSMTCKEYYKLVTERLKELKKNPEANANKIRQYSNFGF